MHAGKNKKSDLVERSQIVTEASEEACKTSWILLGTVYLAHSLFVSEFLISKMGVTISIVYRTGLCGDLYIKNWR